MSIGELADASHGRTYSFARKSRVQDAKIHAARRQGTTRMTQRDCQQVLLKRYGRRQETTNHKPKDNFSSGKIFHCKIIWSIVHSLRHINSKRKEQLWRPGSWEHSASWVDVDSLLLVDAWRGRRAAYFIADSGQSPTETRHSAPRIAATCCQPVCPPRLVRNLHLLADCIL